MIRINCLAFLLSLLCLACEPQTAPQEVLFVCTHGAARSPIAAAYFNQMVEDHGLNYRGVFRGTAPDSLLSIATVDGLEADGFDIQDWRPMAVSDQDISQAFKVVTFDCSIPAVGSSVETIEWNGTPSISKDYNIARDAIRTKVEELIATLEDE